MDKQKITNAINSANNKDFVSFRDNVNEILDKKFIKRLGETKDNIILNLEGGDVDSDKDTKKKKEQNKKDTKERDVDSDKDDGDEDEEETKEEK